MIVPSRIDKRIRILLTKLPGAKELVFLPVRPAPNAQPNECIRAVEYMVANIGGGIVYGWQIWQTPNITEAEFHTVWNSPNKGLLDVTPKPIPLINQILFAEDPTIKYAGCQIDNIRINNTGNPLIDDLISIAEACFLILNAGRRATRLQVELKGEELAIFQYLYMSQANLEAYISNGADNGSICYCGRNLRYFECHGDDLSKTLARLRELLKSTP